jgi:hypothetical protein
LPLVYGKVEYTTLYYNCFHYPVLAMNDPSFSIFVGLDSSMNSLLSTSFGV